MTESSETASSRWTKYLSGVDKGDGVFKYATRIAEGEKNPIFNSLFMEYAGKRPPVSVRQGERCITIARLTAGSISGQHILCRVLFGEEDRGKEIVKRSLEIARVGGYRMEVGVVNGRIMRLELVETGVQTSTGPSQPQSQPEPQTRGQIAEMAVKSK